MKMMRMWELLIMCSMFCPNQDVDGLIDYVFIYLLK